MAVRTVVSSKRRNCGFWALIAVITLTSYFCSLSLQGSISIAFAAMRGPNYMRVIQSSVTAYQSNQTARLSLATQGNIPLQADQFIYSNLVEGLGWVAKIDSNTFKVVAMTLHPVLGRDSSAQDPMRWHAYAVTFRNDGNNIPQQPHDLCIASIDTSHVTGISFNGNKITVLAHISDLPVSSIASFSTAIGFTILRDSGCTSSGLAVRISS
ncbi:MAG TPA: hypothetical protein VIR31_06200 [Nitrososphaeraceae archaeon]